MIRANNINDLYPVILFELFKNGKPSGNMARELHNYQFKLVDLDNNIISCVPVSYEYMLNEMLWYAKGYDDLDFVNKIKSTGFNRTSENDLANSAYGDIIFNRHGYNQLSQVIEALKVNKDTRRAVINLNVPDKNRTSRKDEICTYAMQYYVEDGKLCSTTMMRSNDAYGCLPYDLAFFTTLQKYIAYKTGIPCGSYTHFAVSFHIYSNALTIAENALVIQKNKLPHYWIDPVKMFEEAPSLNLNEDHSNIIELFEKEKIFGKI